jgi:hypothetical protein
MPLGSRLCRLHVYNFTFQHFKALHRFIALLCSLFHLLLQNFHRSRTVTGNRRSGGGDLFGTGDLLAAILTVSVALLARSRLVLAKGLTFISGRLP